MNFQVTTARSSIKSVAVLIALTVSAALLSGPGAQAQTADAAVDAAVRRCVDVMKSSPEYLQLLGPGKAAQRPMVWNAAGRTFVSIALVDEVDEKGKPSRQSLVCEFNGETLVGSTLRTTER